MRGAADFIAWAREAAVHFDRLDDADPELLDPLLAPLLDGKRIVYLSEPDHWIAEKTPYRSLFLRYLCPRGFTHVGEEFGWFDGRLIDRYIVTGDEALFDRVAMFGYKGAERADRIDEMTGLLAPASDTSYPTAEYREHHVRLARTLRAISEARLSGATRVRYFGFDVDASPNSGYEHIAEILDAAPPGDALTALRAALQRVDGESMSDETQRLERALVLFDERQTQVERDLGAQAANELRYSIETMRYVFAYSALVYPATTWDAVADGMALRERIMQCHVQRVLDEAGDDGVVLMSHNLHLAKDDLRIKSPGVGPGGRKERSLGSWLNERLRDQILSVWMLFAHGRDNQPFPSLPTQLSSPPDSLNALLGQVSDCFALPTRSSDKRAKPLRDRADVVMLYNDAARLAVAEQADVVFFVRDVSPLTET